MKRPRDFVTELAIAAAATELTGQAASIDHELAEDLARVALHCLGEITAFARELELAVDAPTKPAAPAWFLPGGDA